MEINDLFFKRDLAKIGSGKYKKYLQNIFADRRQSNNYDKRIHVEFCHKCLPLFHCSVKQ